MTLIKEFLLGTFGCLIASLKVMFRRYFLCVYDNLLDVIEEMINKNFILCCFVDTFIDFESLLKLCIKLALLDVILELEMV